MNWQQLHEEKALVRAWAGVAELLGDQARRSWHVQPQLTAYPGQHIVEARHTASEALIDQLGESGYDKEAICRSRAALDMPASDV